ncbi:WYL domain-containing protein [Tyzzerella sp. OttesenSCG-928-J15]|nr:WYL domain-containing protein [Tyzzerella sp. OttesenSCG-928-J15]
MSVFNELIRNFDKIRDYMRDFYIYGFKSRLDFKHKSPRTYDNEKRRIESYMGEYMNWHYTKSGKNSFISMDCARLEANPLYAAWKSKAFTSNDIMLHFYILDALQMEGTLTVDALTDYICTLSGHTFDVQTVRLKCREYAKNGMLVAGKQGKAISYSLSPITIESLQGIAPNLINAIKFYQAHAAFGEVGSYIMDSAQAKNDLFSFKHYYIAHTLEDGVLLDLLNAMGKSEGVEFENYNESGNWITKHSGIPLKIFVSVYTGRRYVCMYNLKNNRFFTYRLDHVKSVKSTGLFEDTDSLKEKLDKNLPNVWGVSFGGRSRSETIRLTLYIDEEKEKYVLERLIREGKGGEIQKIAPNTFLFTKKVFDSIDATPWVKTFIGRIIKLEGTNQAFVDRFYNDVAKMGRMYNE